MGDLFFAPGGLPVSAAGSGEVEKGQVFVFIL
jgi:hypothetical protein